MNLNFIGVYFVSDEVKNQEEVHELLERKAEELRTKAQEEFDDYVKSLDLSWEMGIVFDPKTLEEQGNDNH